MVITAIQAILIAFVVGIIVGGIIGWKLTFNMRLAKIQELQVVNNNLRDENDKIRTKLRAYNIQKAKENVGKAALTAGSAVTGAASRGANAANSIKDKIFRKKDKKDKKNKE